MKTDDLIRLMTEDTRKPVRLWRRLPLALLAGGLVSLALLLATVGLRDNLAEVLGLWRVGLKITIAALLAVTAAQAVLVAGIPGRKAGDRLGWLLVPLALMAVGIGVEIASVPAASLPARWLGQHAAFCVFFIPVLSLAPLAALLATLRHGAPDSPSRAGAVAGLAAGCLGAALYAWHCPDDSPLFVTWYLVGIAISTAAGSLAGRRLLSW